MAGSRHERGRIDDGGEDRRIRGRETVLDAPEIPVVDHRTREKDADAARERAQHGEPPGPAVDRFHRRVEAHGPAPEQRRPFARGSAIQDLLDLALTAEMADGENGRAVHGEQERRSVKEHDREHVERIVEEIAVADGEGRRPVEMREDAEGNGLGPAPHQQRPDEAQNQIEPDGSGEGPGHMRAHTERDGTAIDPQPPQQDRRRQEEAGHQPPSAFVERRDGEAIRRRRRL